MIEYYSAIDGGTGRWAVTGDDVYFLNAGRWSVSAHSPTQIRGWAEVGLLKRTVAPPAGLALLLAS